MDNIDGSEWVVVIAMMVHLLMAPGTKVEESFNVQATHDLIYHTYNLSAYDHNDFPGVVPRTFAGPIYLAMFGIPFRFILYLTGSPKFWMLFAVRFVLGMSVVIAFLNFARAVRKHFGTETAMFLRIIVASQFHM
ncbi:Mannosyltransferase, partial [Trichostrongylus colubriformis]